MRLITDILIFSDGNVERTSTRVWARSEEYNPELLHKKFFVDDIKYLLTMESLWKERRAPTPSSIIVADLQNPGKIAINRNCFIKFYRKKLPMMIIPI